MLKIGCVSTIWSFIRLLNEIPSLSNALIEMQGPVQMSVYGASVGGDVGVQGDERQSLCA